MTQSDGKPPRRPYVTPRLTTYGEVARLTQSRLLGKKADGGAKLKTKTR